MTHELGHAIGFDADFGAGSGHVIADCLETPGAWNTMCNENNNGTPSGYGYFNRGNGMDFGTYDRTLDDHDTGAINNQYWS